VHRVRERAEGLDVLGRCWAQPYQVPFISGANRTRITRSSSSCRSASSPANSAASAVISSASGLTGSRVTAATEPWVAAWPANWRRYVVSSSVSG
jgi:hypothetical protein